MQNHLMKLRVEMRARSPIYWPLETENDAETLLAGGRAGDLGDNDVAQPVTGAMSGENTNLSGASKIVKPVEETLSTLETLRDDLRQAGNGHSEVSSVEDVLDLTDPLPKPAAEDAGAFEQDYIPKELQPFVEPGESLPDFAGRLRRLWQRFGAEEGTHGPVGSPNAPLTQEEKITMREIDIAIHGSENSEELLKWLAASEPKPPEGV